jgi:hypothetical protein
MTFQVCLFIGNMVFFRSVFFMKSRMNREVHVRFCERFGGETPPYLLDFIRVMVLVIYYLHHYQELCHWFP